MAVAPEMAAFWGTSQYLATILHESYHTHFVTGMALDGPKYSSSSQQPTRYTPRGRQRTILSLAGPKGWTRILVKLKQPPVLEGYPQM